MRYLQHKILRTATELTTHITSIERPLVFTNGCFDILHRGHVTYLEEARLLGSSLIVALNSDDSVRRQDKNKNRDTHKDKQRPLNPLDDRLSLVAALECVDIVTYFEEDTPLSLIEQIKPDVLVKGGDWGLDTIVGKEFVEQSGGRVLSIPFQYQRSTTSLIGKIRSDD